MNECIDKYMERFTAPPDAVCKPFEEDVAKFIPNDIKNAVKFADRLDSLPNSYIPAWVPAGISLWGYIKHEECLGTIHKGMSVLELGSGSGAGTLLWSYMGYPATGIELDSGLVKHSKYVLDSTIELQNAPTRIFEGSYYPENFVKYMTENRDKLVAKVEREELKGWKHDEVSDTYFPVCTEDVYKKNHISLKDFDIIYAYMWAYQMPSVLDLFKQYARDDAVLLAIGPNHTKIAGKLGFKTTYRSHVIRK